jgi:hypothetical protein
MSEPKRRGRPRLHARYPSAQVHVRMPDPLYDAVYRRASQDRQSVPDVIRRVLTLHLSTNTTSQ